MKIFIDGSSLGNPGPAATGVVIIDDDGTTLLEKGEYIGEATNNCAEYRALISALENARLLADKPTITIHTDSQLLARQINGSYRVKNKGLRPLFEKALQLLDGFQEVKILNVPREENKRADRLANRAARTQRDITQQG